MLGLEHGIVDADDDGGVDGVLGRHGEDDLAGAAGEVARQLLALAEDAGGLDHQPDAEIAPGDLAGIALGGHRDPPSPTLSVSSSQRTSPSKTPMMLSYLSR